MPLDLNRLFLGEGTDLNFFQAVHLLERLFPERGKLGTGDDLGSEPLRFETLNSLGFPAGEVAAILPPLSFRAQADILENRRSPDEPGPDPSTLPPLREMPNLGEGPLRMSLTFMGLYGVSSPLPSYFIDPITLRKVEYFELKKFLDIFTHRMYSFFYRAWKKYRHGTQFDPARPDEYTLRLLALTGQWPRRDKRVAVEGQTSDFNLRRIPYARFLGNRVRSAKGLEQLLRGYFGFTRVRIRQFEANWTEIPLKTRLGAPDEGNGIAKLGRSTRIGDRMQDRMSRFTVEIGPVPRALFNRFLPSAREAARPDLGPQARAPKPDGEEAPLEGGLPAQVRELIDAYLRDPLDYQIKVILEPDTRELPALGSEHARVGVGIWLGDRPKGEIACRL
ncbi:MAG: type VI secretion system baseplate subunit TssG [Fibrobacteres bacterium]|nr:type VI secretion system baseplate subunit TssG [Fibrobacterota bacterium]